MDLKLKSFKVSIRISIITLFVVLLGLVGTLIISINHFTLNKILLRVSKGLMQEASSLIKHRLQLYLLPLDRNIIEAGNLMSKGVINPNNKTQFGIYLYELINDNPDIYGAYWGTVAGDFYGVDRESNNNLTLQHIVRSKQPPSNIRYEFDNSGQIKKTTALEKLDYDPRTRSWYQMAVQAKHLIWTDIYSFHLFTGQNSSLPGITAAIPIYDNQQQLLGVLGIDLTINQLTQFINNLMVTKNSIIYITDQFNHLVAFHKLDETIPFIGQALTPELMQQLKIPLPASGLSDKASTIISYHIDQKEYFATYQPLTHDAGNTWHITIIVPGDDIVEPLKKASLQAFILTIISLLAGIMVVRYISQRISRPIIQLADEAKAITELNLTQPSKINTIIREISYMNEAFSALRSSLKSFQRYVPSSLVKKLISSGKIAEVDGENIELSFLFSDISNFTHLAEHTDPQQLMQFLSEYFETMTQAVTQANGTLDKYIGDAVMAFWNAPLPVPDHALRACQTAVDMLNRMQVLNQKWIKQGLPKLAIRIGINSGFAIVGNVGSRERLNYTAIGDNVNLGSRLEALNKIYGTQIIVSQTTYEWVKNHFTFRFLDQVAVRGKEQGVAIYELVTDTTTNLIAYQPQFRSAFNHYQQGDWKGSLSQFEALTELYPNDQLAKLFIKRCKLLIETNPAQWDGIWRME